MIEYIKNFRWIGFKIEFNKINNLKRRTVDDEKNDPAIILTAHFFEHPDDTLTLEKLQAIASAQKYIEQLNARSRRK